MASTSPLIIGTSSSLPFTLSSSQLNSTNRIKISTQDACRGRDNSNNTLQAILYDLSRIFETYGTSFPLSSRVHNNQEKIVIVIHKIAFPIGDEVVVIFELC